MAEYILVDMADALERLVSDRSPSQVQNGRSDPEDPGNRLTGIVDSETGETLAYARLADAGNASLSYAA